MHSLLGISSPDSHMASWLSSVLHSKLSSLWHLPSLPCNILYPLSLLCHQLLISSYATHNILNVLLTCLWSFPNSNDFVWLVSFTRLEPCNLAQSILEMPLKKDKSDPDYSMKYSSRLLSEEPWFCKNLWEKRISWSSKCFMHCRPV